MTITVEHRGLRSVHQTDSMIENDILELQDLVCIDEARVLLERRKECAPAFRVSVHLVTPGPDIRAKAVDQTLNAALRKVSAELRRRIADRAARRLARTQSNLQLPASARMPRRQSGQRRSPSLMARK